MIAEGLGALIAKNPVVAGGVLAVVAGALSFVRAGDRAKPYALWRREQVSGRRAEKRRLLNRQARRALDEIKALGGDGPSREVFVILRNLPAFAFEEVVLLEFERRCFRVRRGARTNDGGVDGEVLMNGTWELIQCKRYTGFIDVSQVVEFAHVCAARKTRGLFIHTGKTPKGAWAALAANRSVVRLISGAKLVDFFQGRKITFDSGASGSGAGCEDG